MSDDDLLNPRRRRGRGRPSVQEDFQRRVPEALLEVEWPASLPPIGAPAAAFPPLTAEDMALLDLLEVQQLDHPQDPHTDEERRLAVQHDWALVAAALKKWNETPSRPLEHIAYETVRERTPGRYDRAEERQAWRIRVHIIRLLARERSGSS